MFLVVLHRSGPQYDRSRPLEEQSDWAAHASFMDGLVDAGFIILGGPLADEYRVVHVVEADSEDDIRATSPWSTSLNANSMPSRPTPSSSTKPTSCEARLLLV